MVRTMEWKVLSTKLRSLICWSWIWFINKQFRWLLYIAPDAHDDYELNKYLSMHVDAFMQFKAYQRSNRIIRGERDG
jgi:hypothetical protein